MFAMSAPEIKPVTKDTSSDDFSYNQRIENEYSDMLNSVVDEIEGILTNYDYTDPMASLDLLQALQDYSNRLFDWAVDNVVKIVYSLNEDDVRQWKMQSSLMSMGLRTEIENVPIEPLINQYMSENVGLIQSIPLTAAQKVQQLVLENLKTGQYRAESLAEQIMKIGSVTRSRANLIARTEIAKISTGLTQARSEELQIGYYVWRTSGDARVRNSHSIMNRVIVGWADPAAPEELAREKKSYGHYHPGQIFNCRCYAQPMIRVDDVKFPAKIYMNGEIRYINRFEFVELSIGRVPLAA